MPTTSVTAARCPNDASKCKECGTIIKKGDARVSVQYGTSVEHFHAKHARAISHRLTYGIHPRFRCDKQVVKQQGLAQAESTAFKAVMDKVSAILKKRCNEDAPDTSRFTASYAPTGVATCRACKERIAKGSVRLTRVVGGDFTPAAGGSGERGISLHYHAAHGLAAVSKVCCGSKAPFLKIDGLTADDAAKIKERFDRAKKARAKTCVAK